MADADIPGAGGKGGGEGGTVMWTLVPEMPQLASYSPYFAVLFRVEKHSTGGAIGERHVPSCRFQILRHQP